MAQSSSPPTAGANPWDTIAEAWNRLAEEPLPAPWKRPAGSAMWSYLAWPNGTVDTGRDVTRADGPLAVADFTGPQPPHPDHLRAWNAERNSLQAEIDRLQATVDRFMSLAPRVPLPAPWREVYDGFPHDGPVWVVDVDGGMAWFAATSYRSWGMRRGPKGKAVAAWAAYGNCTKPPPNPFDSGWRPKGTP
jgi:hypothetical protein